MFTDVQVRGDYPVYMRKEFERRGFEIPFRENDAEILQKMKEGEEYGQSMCSSDFIDI